jgi:flagellar hook-length control protein FliK
MTTLHNATSGKGKSIAIGKDERQPVSGFMGLFMAMQQPQTQDSKVVPAAPAGAEVLASTLENNAVAPDVVMDETVPVNIPLPETVASLLAVQDIIGVASFAAPTVAESPDLPAKETGMPGVVTNTLATETKTIPSEKAHPIPTILPVLNTVKTASPAMTEEPATPLPQQQPASIASAVASTRPLPLEGIKQQQPLKSPETKPAQSNKQPLNEGPEPLPVLKTAHPAAAIESAPITEALTFDEAMTAGVTPASIRNHHDGPLTSGQPSAAITGTGLHRTELAGMLSRLTPPTSSSTSPELTQAPETVQLRQPGWEQSLGQNIQWMVKEDVQSANIRITPQELGPMNIQLSVKDDQLTVQISAQQTVTRETLEAAVPRLREHFQSNGYTHVSVDISSGQGQSRQQGFAESGGSFHGQGFSSEFSADLHAMETPRTASPHYQQGLLDTFA